MTTHYFTTPEGPGERSELELQLRGRTVRMATAPGVFSPKALDKGTAVLLEAVPDPVGPELLDLGCGWGPLTVAMGLASTSGTGTRITAVDVNERSLALTRDNAAALEVPVEVCLPEQVPEARVFSTIWSNPPIRIGKQALYELLLTWLPRLSAEGTAWLVVQKNLGADSLQKWLATALPEATDSGWEVERDSSSKGFRVLRISRSSR